jgi:predicted nucleic acid-binding protein
MKVLLDLNVFLDVVLNREPWVSEAKQVWNAHQSGAIDRFLVATELTNLFYIVRRIAGEPVARTAVRACLATFNIERVDRRILEAADRQPGVDLEDNVCIACAVAAQIDWIVTRDPAGFVQNPIPAVSPADLMARILSKSP